MEPKKSERKPRVESEWWVAFSIAERKLRPPISEGYTLEWKKPEKKGDPGVYERFDGKVEEYEEEKVEVTPEGAPLEYKVRRTRLVYDASKPKPVEPPEDDSIGDVFVRAVRYMDDVLHDVDMVGFEEVLEHSRTVLQSEFSGILAEHEVLLSGSDEEVITVGTWKIRDKAETEAFYRAWHDDPEFHRILKAVAQGRPGSSGQRRLCQDSVHKLWDYARRQEVERTGSRDSEKGGVLHRGRLALSSALTHLYGFPQPRADDVVALAEVTALLCIYEKHRPEDWPEAWESKLDVTWPLFDRLDHAPHVKKTLDLLAHAPGVLRVLPKCRKNAVAKPYANAHVGEVVYRAAVGATDFLGRASDGDDAGTAWEEVLRGFERDAESALGVMSGHRRLAYPKPKGGRTIAGSRSTGRDRLAPYPLPAPPFDEFNDSDDV